MIDGSFVSVGKRLEGNRECPQDTYHTIGAQHVFVEWMNEREFLNLW